MSAKENTMGTLPVRQLLVKMSVPVILSMLVSTLYNVVDSIFVSRLGESALTAMSLGTPVSSLIACVTMLGVYRTSVASIPELTAA